MKDMYKLVKYIDTDQYQELIDSNSFQNHGEGLQALRDGYRKRRLWLRASDFKIAKIFRNAKEHGYVDWLEQKSGKLVVTSKGRHLLGKKFYFYRAGLVDDSLKAYGRSQRFYAGIGIGAIGLIVVQIAAQVIRNLL